MHIVNIYVYIVILKSIKTISNILQQSADPWAQLSMLENIRAKPSLSRGPQEARCESLSFIRCA